MSPKIDQRMLWLRLADTEASVLSEPVDVIEAELASEASIVGEVELANGTIWMPFELHGA